MAKSRSKARRERKKKTGFRGFLETNRYLVLGFIISVIIAAIVIFQPILFDPLPEIDLATIPDRSIGFAAQGRDHIQSSEPLIEYNSNPPTSGPHYSAPARTGTYTRELDDRQLIHNLEHGHIWISYRDEENQELIDDLSAIQDRFPRQIIVTYRSSNNTPISVAAWTRLLELEVYDEDEILAFFKRYFDKGPESVPGDINDEMEQ